MATKKIPFLILVLALFGATLWFLCIPKKENSTSGSMSAVTESQSDEFDSRDGYALVGGVLRPSTDIQPRIDNLSQIPVLVRSHGFSKELLPESNSKVLNVHQSLIERSDPARFSSFVVPKSFDSKAFNDAPKAYATEYAKIVEPGRVFATAQPGKDIVPLQTAGARFHRVKQGETVRLGVNSSVFAPVTFTSQSLGSFEEGLTSTTVVADENGYAAATYTASGGTVDEVQILAGSPTNSGQVTFVVSVETLNTIQAKN